MSTATIDTALSIKAPGNFDFIPAHWPKYCRDLRTYINLSDLVKKRPTVKDQIDFILYIMGGDGKAYEDYDTFKGEVTETSTLENVLQLFSNLYRPQVNSIFERGRLWDRDQQRGESNASYIRTIVALLENCGYEEPHKSQTLRDKLLNGMLDRSLAATLRSNSECTADLVKKELMASEAVKEEERLRQRDKQGPSSAPRNGNLDAVSEQDAVYRGGARPKQQQYQKQPQQQQQQQFAKRGFQQQQKPQKFQQPFQKHGAASLPTSDKKCGNCGRFHARGQCKAVDVICHNCNKRGHFASYCRGAVREVRADPGPEWNFDQSEYINSVTSYDTEEEEGDAYLSELRVKDGTSSKTKPWSCNVMINSSRNVINFKVDSGADVTVISDSDFKLLEPQPRWLPPKRILRAANNELLPTVAVFGAALRFRNSVVWDKVYVVSNLRKPLLSRHLSKMLEILTFHGEETPSSQLEAVRELPVKMKQPVAQVWSHISQLTACKPHAAQLSSEMAGTFNPRVVYAHMFVGLGTLKVVHKIRLKPGAVPHAEVAPNRIALKQWDKIKGKLMLMHGNGVLSRVWHPTKWCARMVTVPKPDDPNEIRICADLTKLNTAIERERIMLPSVNESLARMAGATVFSKLDCKDSFWQVELHPDSKELTTFITPWGRFCYNRLTMGLCSASEVFQAAMVEILEGIPGVVNHIDDIVVFGRSIEEHDVRLRLVMERLSERGVVLNKKCKFRCSAISWVGNVVTSEGVKPDPEKVRAIVAMPAPVDKSGVKTLHAKVEFLRKYVPHMADIMSPITCLLKESKEFYWGEHQQKAFEQLKLCLVNAPILTLYDPAKEHRIASDASAYGIGAVLEQQEESGWLPVDYKSRLLTDTESRYAVIEKEGAGIVWACNKFRDYVLGEHFTIITDHKPLVTIFSSKPLDEMTPRLQRMRMKLMSFDYDIEHIPGIKMYLPDLLSRFPLQETDSELESQIAEIELMGDEALHSLPMADGKLEAIRKAQEADPTVRELVEYATKGFPSKASASAGARQYWAVRDMLTVQSGILLYNTRLVIPDVGELRQEVLTCLHEGHLGITKARARAQQSVYWPGIGAEIASTVTSCVTCCKTRDEIVQPLINSETAEYPWQRVAMDLADINGVPHLVIVDYYSKYPEFHKMTGTTSKEVIDRCKHTFSLFGIPSEVRSDNGPQFSSHEFSEFAESYGFKHTTSSPRYPQANGQAEAGVKVVKNIVGRSVDPYLGMLAYRNTPLSDLHASPAQLLMGRQLRTTVPSLPVNLQTKVIPQAQVLAGAARKSARNKANFDNRHNAKPQTPLQIGTRVWVTDARREGYIFAEATEPRSYLIEAKGGMLRRNVIHLRRLPPVKQVVDEGLPADVFNYRPQLPRQPVVLQQPLVVPPPPPAVEPQAQQTPPRQPRRSDRAARAPARYGW